MQLQFHHFSIVQSVPGGSVQTSPQEDIEAGTFADNPTLPLVKVLAFVVVVVQFSLSMHGGRNKNTLCTNR